MESQTDMWGNEEKQGKMSNSGYVINSTVACHPFTSCILIEYLHSSCALETHQNVPSAL